MNAKISGAMNAKISGAMNRLRAVKGDPMTPRNVTIRPPGNVPSGAKSLRIRLRIERDAETTRRATTRRGEAMTLSDDSIRLLGGAGSGAKNVTIRLRIERGAETTRRRATTRRIVRRAGPIHRRARQSGSIRLLPPAKTLLHAQRNDRRNARRRAGPISNSGIATRSGEIAPPQRGGQQP